MTLTKEEKQFIDRKILEVENVKKDDSALDRIIGFYSHYSNVQTHSTDDEHIEYYLKLLDQIITKNINLEITRFQELEKKSNRDNFISEISNYLEDVKKWSIQKDDNPYLEKLIKKINDFFNLPFNSKTTNKLSTKGEVTERLHDYSKQIINCSKEELEDFFNGTPSTQIKWCLDDCYIFHFIDILEKKKLFEFNDTRNRNEFISANFKTRRGSEFKNLVDPYYRFKHNKLKKVKSIKKIKAFAENIIVKTKSSKDQINQED